MGRALSRLTLDNLTELPPTCAHCVFWELDPVRRELARGHELDEKMAWVSTVLREWGSCGRILYVDDEYAGHLIWAPPVFVPGAGGFATAPVSGDAVLLVTGHVAPAYRGGGLGRVLIQAMAKDLLNRGGSSAVKAIEAFGDTRGRSGHCVLPADFLLAVGFATQRAHAAFPRMRMDLRSTVTWRSEIEGALERLLPRPRRLRQPVTPATPATQRSPRSAR